MDKRIFIASYKDIQVWGNRSDRILSTLEKSDEVFLLDAGVELKKTKQDMIQNMKKKANIHIIECNGENTGIIGKDILLKYLKKEKDARQATLFFIGSDMHCLYGERKEFQSYVASIEENHNFQVKNLAKTKKEPVTNQMDLTDMMAILGNTTMERTDNETLPELELKRQEPEKPLQRTNLAKEPEKTYPRPEPRKSAASHVSQEQTTVEREIFGSSFAKGEYKEEYSELQNAKAKLVLEYNNRLKRHISSELFHKKETITLTESQLFTFILLLISTSNAEEFNQSWSASEADPKIEMKEEMFQRFHAEALFYDKLCTFIYEDDIWGL